MWHSDLHVCTLLLGKDNCFVSNKYLVIPGKVVGIIASRREEWDAIVRENQNCHREYEYGNYCWYYATLKVPEN
jgi:hypothetical protein